MSEEYERRATVITWLRAVRSPKEIVEFTHILKTIEYRIESEFRPAGDQKEEHVSPLRKKLDGSECRKLDPNSLR